MRIGRFSIALAALCLASCTTVPAIPSSPSEICDRTGWDETGGQIVEISYKLFRTAGEFGVDAGKIKGERATYVRALDNQLFGLTQAVQSAYFACNATGYAEALAKAKQALATGDAALKGELP